MTAWGIAVRLDPAEVRAPRAEQREAPAPAVSPEPPAGPGAMTVAGVLSLQRGAGNCAATRALGGVARPSEAPSRPAALPDEPRGIARALARAAAARVDRCPDCGGTCGSTCDPEAEEALQDLATPGERRVDRFTKAAAGGPEPPVSGAPPVIDVDPTYGPPDEIEAEGGAAPAGAAPGGPVVAPTPPGEVDDEVIDETPMDDLDDGPVPEADESEEPETEGAQVARSTITSGSAPPSRGLDSAGALAAFAKASTSIKSTAPSMGLGGNYGLTWPEAVDVKIGAVRVGPNWAPRVTKLTGRYSMQTSLLAGQSEITGPKGNTTQANHCAQVTNLTTLGETQGNPWYMLKAVKRHENVHLKHFRPALKIAKAAIVLALETPTIPHVQGMKKAAAVAALKLDPNFQAAVTQAWQLWLAECANQLAGDHAAGGPCETAEHKIVDPMVKAICKTAKKKKWPACAACPP